MPILERHGVRGTFYVTITAMEQRLDEWKNAVARHHEIGNHSLWHPCTGNLRWSRQNALEDYTLGRMEQELVDASDRIEELVGRRPTTFAYPCGQSHVGRGQALHSYTPLVARLFTAGRGFRSEFVADPAYCDLALLPGIDFDGVGWDAVKPWIQRAIDEGGWVIFAGHDIGTTGRQAVNPDTLDRICGYCRDNSNGIWLDTVAAVAEYINSRRSF